MKLPMFRATSKQVCGLYPYSSGSATPMVGAPLGRHLYTGAAVMCDPISWFEKGGIISAPSMFVLGVPGLGKSTSVRHMLLGMAGYGILPMILGDTKPDYVDLVEALGGQVISLGHDNKINPLDRGSAVGKLHLLDEEARRKVLFSVKSRCLMLVEALITIVRGSEPTDRENTILFGALEEAYETISGREPILEDLLNIIRNAPARLRTAALDRGDIEKYRAVTENLEASLMALCESHYGALFNGQTTVEMKTDRAVVFDVSAFTDSERKLEATVMLTCWSYGFASIEISQALADYGVVERNRYFIVMDELWRILRASSGIVDRVDALTRLNRQYGVGQAMITHTMADLEAIPNEADRAKAKGFVERSKIIMLGGLPAGEMPLLRQVVKLTDAEQQLVSSWGNATPLSDKNTPPPGRGKFLVKVGSQPGIPIQVDLTDVERELNNTNKRWNL